ncbi:hypothetical protein HQQ81_02010 [Microbacteriaceae bacterium VKM Ac-2854]|nr:hypothetical protein [Microbacteriaceae bacterium VKM Ac-2854]
MKIPDISRFVPSEAVLFEYVEMAEGPTLWSTLEFSRRLFVGTCAVGALGLMMMFAVDFFAVKVIALSLIAVAVIAVWVEPALTGPRSDRAREAEMELGYTTSRTGFGSFPEVDPETSRIIRLPGEPFLNDADRDERRRQMVRRA